MLCILRFQQSVQSYKKVYQRKQEKNALVSECVMPEKSVFQFPRGGGGGESHKDSRMCATTFWRNAKSTSDQAISCKLHY